MTAAAGGLHPQVAALLAGPEGAVVTHRDPVTLRAEHEAGTAELAGPPEPVARVFDRSDGGVRMRIYEPDGGQGTVVYLHGGGWVIGSIESHDHVGRMLANAARARVVLPDYRLAPEHAFPAALEDAETAFEAARGFGEPVAVAGDSAGGTLAAVLARRHPEVVRAQALAYPVLDAAMATESYRAFSGGFRLTADDMAWFFAQYGGDPADPDVSPLLAADLRHLPPATIVLASHDVLRDEGEAYAERLRAAGVDATVSVYDGMVHGFLRWPAKVDAARAAIAELGGALRTALSA